VDLDSLSSSPVGSQHTRSPDLAAIKDSGSDDRVQEVHLGRDILEVKLNEVKMQATEGRSPRRKWVLSPRMNENNRHRYPLGYE
jgi:hypothetical protein